MSVALISAVVALVSGLITAAVTGWLAGRAKVAEELRELRLTVYPPVWKRTSVFSRWPRTDVTYDGVQRFHVDLRKWYFELGGLYLSENARDRYGDLQELVEAHLDYHSDPEGDELPTPVYDDLMETSSAFRTALTEDLESRRQSSLWWTLSRARLHRSQHRDARRRLQNAKADDVRPRVRYALTDADHTIADPEPEATPRQRDVGV